MSITLASAMAATQGARRYQEDSALFLDAERTCKALRDADLPLPRVAAGEVLAVLGDGMGGHVGGATASRLATEAFLSGFFASTHKTSGRLLEGLDAANLALAEKIAARPMFSGMGTTLIGAFVQDTALSWVSIGDSLLYLWRRGELARLNEDHSMAPEIDKLVASGKMSPEEGANDPRRHYLRAAVTGDALELIDVSMKPLDLAAGDVVLLASDGIHTLEESAIAAIVSEQAPKGAAAIAEALVRAIDDIGARHQDNTTVIAITLCEAAPQ